MALARREHRNAAIASTPRGSQSRTDSDRLKPPRLLAPSSAENLLSLGHSKETAPRAEDRDKAGRRQSPRKSVTKQVDEKDRTHRAISTSPVTEALAEKVQGLPCPYRGGGGLLKAQAAVSRRTSKVHKTASQKILESSALSTDRSRP